MSLSSLRERLIDQLEPAAAWTPGRPPARSDFDLNPGAERPERTLRPAAVLIPVIAGPEGAAVLMTRDSAYAKAFCKLCAQVCRDCAEECGKHQHDHCQACAEACRKGAEQCEKMAA
jgi:hypothetical protein